MKRIIVLFLFCFVIILTGCSTESIYIPHGQAVQLREPINNVKVWVKTKTGNEPATITLPEGWFCLP
jgi:hypothetical protein